MNSILDFILIIIFFVIGLVDIICKEYVDLDVIKYQVVIINVYTVFMGMRTYKMLLHPYNVFIFMYTMFLCGKVYFDIFDIYPFGAAGAFSKYLFYENTQLVMLVCILLGLNSANLARFITRKYSNGKRLFSLEYNAIALRWSKIGMILCMPFSIVLLIMKHQTIAQYGYLALYQYQAGITNETSYLDHLNILFHVFYCSFLASGPKKRDFKIYSAVEIFVLGVSLLTGVRGTFGVNILIMLSWYSLYIKLINWKKIASLALLLICLFQIVGVYRSGNNLDVLEDDDLNIVAAFIRGRSDSLNVLGYVEESDNNGLIDLVYPIVQYVEQKTSENNDAVLWALANRLSYEANPSMYLEGQGMGTTYLAELYSSFGFLGVIIGTVAIVYFMLYLLYKHSNAYMGTFGLFLFLREFYYMPRAPFLNFIIGVGKYMIVILMIRSLYRWRMSCAKKIR